MEVLIVVVVLGTAAINLLAVVLGRTRETKYERMAFASGLAGLAAYPVAIVGALLGFVPAPLDGPTPVLLLLSLIALAGATLCSAAMLVPLLRSVGPGPNNSSKPTPLRGAA